MTIQENIDRIFAAKADIKAAIERKGVTVGDALISEYASKIDQIETGGDYDEGFAAGYQSGYTKGDTDGYNRGYSSGETAGYASGKTDGYNEGYQSGYTKGDEDGYERGYDEGFADGYTSGKADGYDEGYQSGYTTGIIDAKGDMISTSITENGTYTREEGFNSVEVNVQGGEVAMTHFAINLTPANIDSTVSVSANGETHTYHNESGRIEFDLYGGLEYTISFGSVSGYYTPMDITGISMYAASNEYSATYERSVSSDYLTLYYNVTSTTKAYAIVKDPIAGEYISIDGGDWIPAKSAHTFSTNEEHIVLYKNTNAGYENVIRSRLLVRGEMYKVVIPDTITEIGATAFGGAVSLVSIIIGNSVTTIGNYAFQQCSGLTTVEMGNSVSSIGEGAFSWCTKLTGITIPEGVTSIRWYVFQNCSGLTSIVIPDYVTTIGADAFGGCNNVTSLTIGSSVTSIDLSAFAFLSSVESIVCKAPTAPSLESNSFERIREGGILYVPEGSDYSNWLSYLPSGWIIQTINS